MSRCYPYPSPRYRRSGGGAHKEPSRIEPLKIQTKREKVLTEPRKEKRQKKERTNVRKRDGEYPLFEDKRHISGKSLFFIAKEEEQERSDVTEEHEEPVHSRGYCYLVDSHDSSNREKDESASATGGRKRNIIRIRIPSQRPRETDEAQLCSTSGRDDTTTTQKDVQVDQRDSSTSSLNSKISISFPEPALFPEKAGCSDSTHKGSIIFERAVPTVESLYKALIEDWTPPILRPEQDDLGDQEWLFGNQEGEQKRKRLKVERDTSRIGSSDLWPRAKYLPDADIYALPFSVPF